MMKTTQGLVLGLGVTALALAEPAAAQEQGTFYIQAGIGHIDLQDSFSGFTIGGVEDPAADASVSDPTNLIVNGGYFFRDDWSVSVTGGTPATSTATGEGSLAPLGELGKITFGIAEVALNYHFDTGGRFQPFVGAGLAYGIIFDTDDGALTNVSVDNEFGYAIRAGFDYMFNDTFGSYFAISQAFVDFDINGMAGPNPATVNAELNPVLIQTGLTYRF